MFSTIRFRPRKAFRRPPRRTPSSVVSRVSPGATSREAQGLKDKAVRGRKALVRAREARDLKTMARGLKALAPVRAVKGRTSRPRSLRIRG